MFFDKRDYELIRIVNSVLGGSGRDTHTRRHYYTYFHAQGIKEMAESKGLRTAYATIHLLSSLEKGGVDDRIKALSALRKEVIDTAEGALPKNTARVLLQIMKTLVRAHGDVHRQLKLAHDFRMTASGKPRVVRRQLQQYHLLEMPEEWNQIAFDDHVHDANTKGRKSPTHLIMDAWIKGIRRLRVIHYHYIEPRFAAELLEAAVILEIDVRIGIEYYACYRNKYIQLIWVPRGFSDAQAFLCFLAEPPVVEVMEAGREAAQYLQRYVMELLHRYNEVHRLDINKRLGVELPVIGEQAFLKFVGIGQKSKLHLAKYIHGQVLDALDHKVRQLRSEMPEATADRRRDIIQQIESANRLDLEEMLDTCFQKANNPGIAYPDLPGDDPDAPGLLRLTPREILNRLTQLSTGYRVTLNLSNVKVHEVLELLYDCQGMITRLEIFNLKDQAAGQTDHIADISRLQQTINQNNVINLKRLIQNIIDQYASNGGGDADQAEKLNSILHDIDAFKAFYTVKLLKARIGSDSTGRSPKVLGMGLVVQNTLPRRVQHKIERDVSADLRQIIPIDITALRSTLDIPKPLNRPFGKFMKQLADRFEGLRRLGYYRKKGWQVQSETIQMAPRGNVVTLGGVQKTIDNGFQTRPGDEKRRRRWGWPHLNTHLKNSLKVIIGFIPAFATFALTKDWWVLAYLGAFIWFGITGLRNIVQSILGGGGLRRSPLLDWNDLISWTRLTDSLLYTGFSVPLLDYLVKTILLDRWLNITTATHPLLLYSCIALANGIYLSSHNAFRGLPKGAVYGNFFRSILSIPIAIALNTAAAALLSMAGAVAVDNILQKWAAVISKAASDIVAAVIEGTADRYNNIQMRLRAYKNKFRDLIDVYAQLELCYPDVESHRVLEYASHSREKACAEAQDLEKIIMIHALDLLYFWMYQPRARVAMKEFLSSLSEDERHILVSSQFTLLRHREVSQMFIDEMLGKNFPKPLSFYLSRHEEYLEAVKGMVWTHENTADIG
ncbi:MAG: hypothetical protein HKM93_01190 [Desulfobacteraceae bacterium]|nr:hypothetical protein [Desulfobacteraceae bacterium]